jgi:riboflavin synthase
MHLTFPSNSVSSAADCAGLFEMLDRTPQFHMTTLKNLTAGSRVNLEVDLIARYEERMMSAAS